MKHLLLLLLVASLLGPLLAPGTADALPYAAVGYKLYHYEGGNWVRYKQGDPFPSGGATPGTNLWKYNYWVANVAAPANIYQFQAHFNSDDVLRATYSPPATGPTTWNPTYIGPSVGHYVWKLRFRTTDSARFIAVGDSLPGYEIQFTWTDPGLLPTPQNYDAVWSGGSEPGNTTEMPPDMTPVEAATWSKIKTFFR